MKACSTPLTLIGPRNWDGKIGTPIAQLCTTLLRMLVVLGEIFMPAVISVLAPGFADTPERMTAAVTLARVSFPYLPMISLVAFWSAIANAEGRFMMAAAMPVLFNLCLVGGALVIPVATGWLAVERAMPLATAGPSRTPGRWHCTRTHWPASATAASPAARPLLRSTAGPARTHRWWHCK